ncbi:unnamed protein product [Parnassius mnemosyne]|uniref:Peptidase S1 domain-containing protein n=1 Tax=Parnassius mnemosyne TaxID=213953 RepID=A0AAV1LJ81_9NEOP
MNVVSTVFPSLENFEINATLVEENKYPWIARVVHSRTSNTPVVCTAVCVDRRIFITAAVCISTLKVYYTTVIYQYGWLPAMAFVVPANGSKQGFDDIGFIIVEADESTRWHTIELFGTNRTDEAFKWFSDLFHTDKITHKVVGFAVPKILQKVVIADRPFHICELPVVVNINLCPSILTFKNTFSGFNVPCYHSCSVKEYEAKEKNCENYHGVKGGAVINTNTNKLLGVATWGAISTNPLPVGFAVPNSANFFKNYQCAQRIRDDQEISVTAGYYQSLCDE